MSNWEWKKLGDVCEFQGGAQPPKEEWIKENRSGYIRMLQIRDFTQSRNFDIEYVKKTSKLRICNENDILLGRYGASVGKVLTGLSGAYNVAIVKTIPNSEYSKLFIKYYFQSPLFQTRLLNLCNQRTAQAGFNKEDIYDFPIPYISLNEQKHVVKTLDEKFAKIDKLKTAAETNLKNAKALYQKSLDKIIEDECRRYTLTSLKEITTKIGSGATPKGGKKSYQTEGISLIRSMNVLYGSFSYDNLAHINEKQAKALDGVAIQCADVLFNITGASIARCCVVPDDVIPARVNQHVSILRPIQKVLNSDYLSVVLLASQNQKKLLDIGEAGATRQALTKGDLEVFPIPLPPLSVQKEIVARLDKLSENVKRLEANYKQIIANCDELKKSILKKTFEEKT